MAHLPAIAFSVGALATTLVLARKGRKQREALEGELATAERVAEAVAPWQEITAEDMAYVQMTKELAARVPRPIHSDFLVASTISYWDADHKPQHVQGVNNETCVIVSSICAERTALCQLRMRPSFKNIRTVYITTSMPDSLITPGVLCR